MIKYSLLVALALLTTTTDDGITPCYLKCQREACAKRCNGDPPPLDCAKCGEEHDQPCIRKCRPVSRCQP